MAMDTGRAAVLYPDTAAGAARGLHGLGKLWDVLSWGRRGPLSSGMVWPLPGTCRSRRCR